MTSTQHTNPTPLFQLPNCIVCMQRLQTDVYFLKCGHVFHQECILNCMKKNNKECPMCKKRIQSEKDVNKLFFEVQKNTATEEQIQKILEEFKQEEDGNVFNKAIGKLRKALSENEVMAEKLRVVEVEKGEMRKKEEELNQGLRMVEKETRRAEKEKREMGEEIENLKRYSSILEGDKEDLEKVIKSQSAELAQFQMFKKAEKDKGRDNNFYESMKNQYLLSDPVLGLQYFCQLSESLNLDIRRLERDLVNVSKSNKQMDKSSSELRKKREQLDINVEKEREMSMYWENKYHVTQEKLNRLMRKMKERNLEGDLNLDQNSNTSQVRMRQDKRNEPAMLFKKEKREEEKDREGEKEKQKGTGGGLFEDLGLPMFKRLEQKKKFNGFRIDK